MYRILSLVCAAVIVVVGAQSAAFAVGACRDIKDPAVRLACYDALDRNGGMNRPVSSVVGGSCDAEKTQLQQAIILKESEISKLKEVQAKDADSSFFGITRTHTAKDPLNQASMIPDQQVERDEEGNVESLMSNITEFSIAADGMITVVLDNGQVWRQVSGRGLYVRSGGSHHNVAKIMRTMLGGFAMTVNGKNDVAIVKRIDGKRR